MKRRILVVDAFTTRVLDGNSAGVVFDGVGLTDDQMLLIAREVNASETAFVVPAERADFGLRFFTPAVEVPFCGHAFVGAVAALAEEGRVKMEGAFTRLEVATAVGRHATDLRRIDGHWWVEVTQASPVFRPVTHPADALCSALGIEPDELDASLPIEQAYTGLWHLMIPLREVASVVGARPRGELLAALNENMGASGTHLFAPAERGWRTRDFAPAAGIYEDPVTGSASGALGAYLVRHGKEQPCRIIDLEQRRADGRGGNVSVRVEGDIGRPERVLVGGFAVISLCGEMELGDG